MGIAFMEGSRYQENDIIDLIRVCDVVEELCEITNSLGTKVVEFIHEFFNSFFGNGRS